MGAVEKGLWVPFTTSLATFLLGFYVGFLKSSSVVDQAFLHSHQGLPSSSGQHPHFLNLARNIGGRAPVFSGY